MIQTRSFVFSKENQKQAEKIISRYPKTHQQSAVVPLLEMAQRQNGGYLSPEAIEYVSDLLKLSYLKAYEIASFYSMLNLKPVGKYHIQVCGTTPCWLRGSDEILDTCKKVLSIETGQTTENGLFTLTEVECLGACRSAPVIQVNDDYYENLSAKTVENLISKLSSSKK